MTQKAAIGLALLKGEMLSIMNGFQLFHCTNIPREISRSIEQEFGIRVSREKVPFRSKYGQQGFYFRYRLNFTDYNRKGIDKLKEYVKQQIAITKPARTQKELREQRQLQLLLK